MKSELKGKILEAFSEYQAAVEQAEAEGRDPEDIARPFDFPWSETAYGSDGRALDIHERSDRPGSVRVRWTLKAIEHAKRGGPRRPKPSVDLPAPIRGSKGQLLKRSLGPAIAAAQQLYEDWLNPPASGDRAPDAPFTMREGFEYAAHETKGLPIETDQWRRWLFARPEDDGNATVSVWQVVDRIIGLDTPWAEYGLEQSRIIWRTLARESEDGSGARAAEQIVGAVFTIADHLRAVGKIGDGDCVAPRGWRQMLRREWQADTGTEIEVERHRYDEAETATLVRGFREAEDPRVRTAGVFGIGFRRGQVVRTPRSRLHLDDSGAYGHGHVVIPGATGKKGGTVDLTPPMRRYFEWLLAEGYLSDLERARANGVIDDYYLLPGYRLRGGRAQVRYHETHMTRGTLGRLFNELEAQLGVKHKKGRSWHALRRSMSDEIAEETTDETVRDMAQGWTPGGGTRAGLYMDKEREKKAREAAEARNAAIRRLVGTDDTAAALQAAVESTARTVTTIERLIDEEPELDFSDALGAATALADALHILTEDARGLARPGEVLHRGGAYQTHDALADAVRNEIERRGLTGKEAAELADTTGSTISAIRNGKSRGVVAMDRLNKVLEALRSLPETEG